MRATCGRTERPRRALLYSDIEVWLWLHRIDGRLGTWGFGLSGVVLGIPSFFNSTSNSSPSAGWRTMSDGQFDWGGRLPKLSLIHISEPTRLGMISYAVFCLKKKKK